MTQIIEIDKKNISTLSREDLRLLNEINTKEGWYSLETEDQKAFQKRIAGYKGAKFEALSHTEIQKRDWILPANKKYTSQLKKNMTFHLLASDIEAIKQKAEQEGIPYQTLVSAIFHKIATGKIELVVK